MEDDLAIGVGAQAVLELALPELDRRLHARLPEPQGVVVLAAKLDAHSGFAARRPAASEGRARPVLHLLNLRRPGHEGILRRVGWDVGGVQRHGARNSEERDKQRRSQEAKTLSGTWVPKHRRRMGPAC